MNARPDRSFSPALRTVFLAAYVLLAGTAAFPDWRGTFVVLALALSAAVVWFSQRVRLSMRDVLLFALLIRVCFFPLLPSLSDDTYRYVWDGLVQHAGFNPYLHRPSDAALSALHGSTLYPLLNSPDYFSVYPPFSQVVFWIGGFFYGLGWEASYYVIKGVFTGMEFGGVLLLARMVQARTLVLYAWHPLAVIEAAGQGHTEGAVVLFLVLVLWLARGEGGGLAGAALAGATWVKLSPVVLGPFLLKRWGWKPLVGGAAVSILLLLPYAHPQALPHVLESLNLYVRLFEFNAGPYYAVKGAMRWLTGTDWSKTIGPAMAWIFAAGLVWLYVKAIRKPVPLAHFFEAALGLFLVTATTIHPWYLLPVLFVSLLLESKKWYWLAAWSVGTYGFYTGGAYWPFVIIGWGGWFILLLWENRASLLHRLLRWRAHRKFRRLRPGLAGLPPGFQLLDLGAGEGYVGERAASELQARVTLADVVASNRTTLPHVRYDGETLPFDHHAFDATLLIFVLHHAASPELVLREVRRVTRARVVVLESVYRWEWERKVLEWMDRRVNGWRSGGANDPLLQLKKTPEWVALFEQVGFQVVHAEEGRRMVDRWGVFWLDPKKEDA